MRNSYKNNIIILISLLISVLLLDGCISNQSSTGSETSYGFRKDLPPGYAFGKVEPYQGKDRVESNLISQINTYNSALLMGDIDNAKLYLYPDAIKYYKKFYPSNLSLDDIANNLFKEISEAAIELEKAWQKYGVDVDILVSGIERKIELGDTKIFVFSFTTLFYMENAEEEKYFHSTTENDDLTVGISFNGGRNWYFIALNDETPNILRLRLAQSVVNEVMGY